MKEIVIIYGKCGKGKSWITALFAAVGGSDLVLGD